MTGRLEKQVQNLVMLAVAKIGTIIFRVNTGQAWGGSRVIPQKGNRVLIEDAMPIQMGLTKGGSDLIGWTPVEITPEMVGRKVAVFTAIECKREKGGRLSTEQGRFLRRVRDDGGIAGVANSPEAAVAIIERG
jgi:hypothetical protein|tara:strand:- start:5569 stop:5967 length:399 start_codon:yes stop_codon:yes gene_type:complete